MALFREYSLTVWDRQGSEIHKTKTRDRVIMLQELDRQTLRHDLDLARIAISIKVVEQDGSEVT